MRLSDEELIMDRALAAIYDQTDGAGEGNASSGSSSRGAGQGKSAPLACDMQFLQCKNFAFAGFLSHE
ncbi:hypothetical protein D3C73_1330140 [compost metagenome]